jgi:hypothetical protein
MVNWYSHVTRTGEMHIPIKLAQAVTIPWCIREIIGSRGYDFTKFSSICVFDVIGLQIRPQKIHLASFPILHSITNHPAIRHNWSTDSEFK